MNPLITWKCQRSRAYRRCVIDIAIAVLQANHPRITRGVDESIECVIARPQRRGLSNEILHACVTLRPRGSRACGPNERPGTQNARIRASVPGAIKLVRVRQFEALVVVYRQLATTGREIHADREH